MTAALARMDLLKAVQTCAVLHARGFASTIGSWNRIKHSSEEVADEYLASLQAVRVSGLDCYVSIKPLALAFRRDLLMKLVLRARDLGIRLHFDSPSAELADITFSAIAESLERYDAIGCTLPGRWPRSLRDAEWAIERNLPVRVVKGQWADLDHPLEDARKGFLALIDRIAGRARHVGVATHDVWLAREAISRLRAAGTSCELEFLVGQPADLVLPMAQAIGVRIRGYVPYGDDQMVYGSTRRSAAANEDEGTARPFRFSLRRRAARGARLRRGQGRAPGY